MITGHTEQPKFYSVIRLSLQFRRLSAFYVRNLILPNALLLTLSSLTFFLPGDSGDRIGFGVTVTLTLCVNLVIVIDFIPETSKTIPSLCNYYLVSIFCSGFSLLMAALSLNAHVWALHMRTRETNKSIVELANAATVASMQQFNLQPKKTQMTQTVHPDETFNTFCSADGVFFKSLRKLDLILGVCYLVGTTLYSSLFIYLQWRILCHLRFLSVPFSQRATTLLHAHLKMVSRGRFKIKDML